MINPITPLALIIATTLAGCTNTASTQATGHSAAAGVAGSQALGQSVSTTVGVPLIVSGAALVVSGAALASPAPIAAHPTVAPNSAPSL